jgi:hypothetical protein
LLHRTISHLDIEEHWDLHESLPKALTKTSQEKLKP